MKACFFHGGPYIFLRYNFRYRKGKYTIAYLCKCSFLKLHFQFLHQSNTISNRTRLQGRRNCAFCFLHKGKHGMQSFFRIHFCLNNRTSSCQNASQIIQIKVCRHTENRLAFSACQNSYMNDVCIHVNSEHAVRCFCSCVFFRLHKSFLFPFR